MKLTEKQKNCLYCSPDYKGVVPIVEDGGDFLKVFRRQLALLN